MEEKGGMNLYGFVYNNHLKYYDVLGREPIERDEGIQPPPLDREKAKGANCVGIAFRTYENTNEEAKVDELFRLNKCKEIPCDQDCLSPNTKFYRFKLQVRIVFVNTKTGKTEQEDPVYNDEHVGSGSWGNPTKFTNEGRLCDIDNDLITDKPGSATEFPIDGPLQHDAEQRIRVVKIVSKTCYCCECFNAK
jgi:hypothetical protein